MSVETALNVSSHGSSAGTPNGFRIAGLPLIGPGIRAGLTIAATVPATSSHASQRQRGDGRWPSGIDERDPGGGDDDRRDEQHVRQPTPRTPVSGQSPPAATLAVE